MSNLRTRLQSGEKGVVTGHYALLRCVIAVSVLFYESIISGSDIRNRQFHICGKGGVFCAMLKDDD